MSAIAFPVPDAGILARRESIIAGLARLVPPQALITSDDERRPYETDALTAYRRMTQLAKGFADKGTTTPVVHTAELLDWATGGPLPEKLARAGIEDRRLRVQALAAE